MEIMKTTIISDKGYPLQVGRMYACHNLAYSDNFTVDITLVKLTKRGKATLSYYTTVTPSNRAEMTVKADTLSWKEL
jgi:hypothetical protein